MNALGDKPMRFASTKPADKGKLAVLNVITKGQLMRQQRLSDAI
jgi:hypothetical protein